MKKLVTATILMFALSLGLSACGKKGPLELPPGAEQEKAKKSDD